MSNCRQCMTKSMALLAALCMAPVAQGAILTYEFTASFLNNTGLAVLGIAPGSSATASGTVVLDDSSALFLPNGTLTATGETIDTDSYAFGAGSVVSFSATLGDMAWSAADLRNQGFGPGQFAPVFVAGSLSNPSALWFFANGNAGSLLWNPAGCTSTTCSFRSTALARDKTNSFGLSTFDTAASVVAADVPEPATAWLLLSGLVGLGAASGRRRAHA